MKVMGARSPGDGAGASGNGAGSPDNGAGSPDNRGRVLPAALGKGCRKNRPFCWFVFVAGLVSLAYSGVLPAYFAVSAACSRVLPAYSGVLPAGSLQLIPVSCRLVYIPPSLGQNWLLQHNCSKNKLK